MHDNLEKKYLRFIRNEPKGFVSFLLNIFLTPLSWIYSLVIVLRNKAYDYGLFKVQSADVPAVVSIGNIVVGGTGKTPVTMMLTKELLNRFPIAILSRGYRSHAENLKTPLILCNGSGPEYPVSLCGDEPYLMAENIPEAHIYVGKDRFQSAQMAVNHGAKLVILDDGMQHRQLARDFDVIVMDASDPFGKGKLLPKGLLREQLSSLKRADIIVLNNITDTKQYTSISKEITKYSSAPVVGTKVNVVMVKNIDDSPIDSLKGKNIGMLCGIGSPENFKNTLEELGANITTSLVLPDHKTVSKKKLLTFIETCQSKGVEYIACTEKDKVKLKEVESKLIPLVWVKIELQVQEGINHWKEFIKKTVQMVNKNKDRN
ncbi:MAG: tetraacyldisaccharide 4'-kinase [Chlamydiota bacterium]|nr:tetraacyldisaccharide 4'-kinase [Chlamydiota bacterium]